MKFNSGTDSLYADALYWAGADATTYPVNPDFTRNANQALDRVTALILRADSRWQHDDTNLATELIDTTTNLVSGTQKYAINVAWLKIARVRVKDQNGNWVTLKPKDRRQMFDSEINASGTPEYYDKLGNYLYLFPKPNYSQSGGVEVQFQRGADYFLTSDTTKAPGFATQFHRLISLYAALDYTEPNDLESRTRKIQARIDKMEEELLEHYSQRDNDEIPNLHVRSEQYGQEGGTDGSPLAFYA